ncbi:MAG: hypothetical protein AABY84_11765 [Candidatus Firestonebacteria bacterium]
MKKIFLKSGFILIIIFLQNIVLCNIALCAEESEEKLVSPTEYNFKTYFHSRISYNMISNTTDLSSDSDDNAGYLSYLYDIGFYLKYAGSTEFFLKMVRATRSNYDAPVSGSKIVVWPGSEFDKYTSTESILPRITEYWLDVPILESSMNTRFKAGLFSNILGNGFVGGKYENYGFSFYNTSGKIKYNFHTEIADYNNKILLGPHIEQEKFFTYNDTNAYLVSADFRINMGHFNFEPYVSLLRDTTQNSSRESLIATPTDEDILGTAGMMGLINFDELTVDFEYAKNFGKAISASKSYPDVAHKGYLVYGNVSYSIYDMLIPKVGIIMASGNKITDADLDALKLTGDTNNAFSVFSPSNTNLFDTQYPKKSGPFIATGSGHAINYGIPRPGTFSNANLLENLDAKYIGLSAVPISYLYFSLDYWFLKSMETYPGTNSLSNGSKTEFSNNLGSELDLFGSIQIRSNISFNIIYAYWTPGDYYKELRNQYSGTGFTPLVRADGIADGISQFEIGVEFLF